MNPDAQREAELFQAAAELTGPARAAFLDGACHGNPALRQRFEALLAANDAKDSFLEPEEQEPAEPLLKTMKLSLPATPDEAVGQTLGRYKLLERVGEGGCGVVYVAEQTEPVRRRVALKVIKLGMDTKQVVARFEAERQALAMMDHPNIAKVLDAGTTEMGRPFFVMELVRGIRITDYCDQANLNTAERLDLFIKVCQAIQHAHQKGIIHRDIKPSNILVTLHDGVPVPKVIDFGIAKATEGRLTDATVYTQLHQFIGTPAYMSPEQAEMSGLDIDTRSDIYSLGVLLYELLAGSTPFDGQELMSQGIDAMRKTIREKEPVRPSTKLATLKDDELTTTAKRRSVETSKLANLLRGDLDWIVMKCLEKDRTRRYDTANGLAFDLKRHLSNEPVLARPPSAAYRFQKAFRRNKLTFAAGAAVIVALLAGLSLAALGWRQTRAERDKAIQAQASEEAQRKEAQTSEQKAIVAEAAQIRLRKQAEAQTLAARRSAYNSDMNQVQQLLRVNNLGAAQRLLDRQRPSQDQPDLRGWEWRYLWSQARADDHEVFIAATNQGVGSMTFNADGRLLARKRGGERLTVTDMKSRRVVFQPPNAYLPAFAHHDNRLAFIYRRDTSNDVIRIVNVDTVRPNLSAQHESRIEMPWKTTVRLAFAANDRRLFTVSAQPDEGSSDEPPYSLTAWDVDTGRQLWQRRIHYSWKSGNRRPLDISSDGTAIAFLQGGGRLEVVETEDGRTRFTTKIAGECYYTVTFSPDGSTLLSGAGLSAIQLWDARSGAPAGSLEGHNAWVNDLQFSVDGKRLISSSEDQTIRVWDWSSRKPTSVFRSPPGVYGLAPGAGHTLATRTYDHSIWLWNLSKPSQNLGYQTRSNSIVRVVFTPDSQSILGSEGDRGVTLWDARTLKETRRLWGTTRQQSFFSPDAKWVLRSDGEVWDVKSGLTTTNFVSGLGTLATRPRFTANGKFLVTRSGPVSNSVLEVWDTATWRRKDSRSFEFKRIADWPGGYSPALTNSYALMADGAVHLFDVTKLSEPPKKLPSPNGVYDFVTSPDGRLAVGAFKGGSVLFWDVETSKLLESRRAFLLDVRSAAFSPDGQRLAVSSTGLEAVKLWDVETRQELLTLSGEGELQYLTFSPDGRHLLGINDVGRLHLWSAPSMEEINAAETKENAVVKQP